MKHLLLLMLLPAFCFGQTSIHPLTGGFGFAIPGMIQAEAANPDSGVVEHVTTDTSGFDEIDSIVNGDWMEYETDVNTASLYTVSFRVATAGPGASFELLNYNTGTVLTTVSLPNTGGLTHWQTVTASVNLPQGLVLLRVQGTSTTLWDFNWMDLEFPNMPPPAAAQVIPGMIQAESYFAHVGDTTHATSDFGKGLDVGRVGLGDYMDYYVSVPSAGLYTISCRLATSADNATFDIEDILGEGELVNVQVPNTGGFQKWRTINVEAYLPQGLRILRFRGTSNDKWNINWMFFVQGFQSTGYQTIPGLIQAEWFIFESGVGTEPTSDPGGVFDVGWIDKDDWMNYNTVVNSAGTYMVNFRIATIDAHASFRLYSNDGSVLATVRLPNTGGYQRWSTVSVPVELKAGVDTMWIVSTSVSNWNIDWMQFTAVTDSAAAVIAALSGTASAFSDSAAMAAGTRLWPNPVQDVFTVQLNDGYAGNMMIQVMDAAGVVRSTTSFVKTPGMNQVRVNAVGLATGVYFVRIVRADRQEARQIFKL